MRCGGHGRRGAPGFGESYSCTWYGQASFLAEYAQRQGIHTIFAAENYIDAITFKVGLRHFELLDYVDLRLARGVPARRAMGGKPHVRDDTAPSTPPVALATVATSADVWHRRLGHPNEAVVRAVAKIPETGVVLSDAMSKCDTCLVGKGIQQAHPKTTIHKASEPLGCVYTDIIGPVSPVAKGGYMYVSKFTDELTRYKAFYLIRSKLKRLTRLCALFKILPSRTVVGLCVCAPTAVVNIVRDTFRSTVSRQASYKNLLTPTLPSRTASPNGTTVPSWE